ncbi:MAG: ATP-binding protein [Gammaproteobacteria bacterium]|nr:ATP-binding protein [Gammaproteobacteria bacterium]
MLPDNFLNSGFTFNQSEANLHYRYRVLNSVLTIAALFSFLFALLSDLGFNDIGPIHSKVDYLYSVICFLSILLLRKRRGLFTLVATILVVTTFLTFVSALLFVSSDEFRLVWFYLVVYISYILLGPRAGIWMTVSSIAVVILCAQLFELQLSQTSMVTALLGLVIASLLYHSYSRHMADSLTELDMALKQANEANKAKNLFLAKISHEFRTPLNGLLGMAHILRGTKLDDEQKHYLDSFEHSGKILKTLIDELLDLSKIEAGRLQLVNRSFDTFQLALDVQVASEWLFDGSAVVFSTDFDAGMPLQLIGDRERLMQVILNLVNNAAKFTPQGEVTLQIGGEIIADTYRLHVEVRDTGIGIPEEKQEEIFGNFNQLATDRNLNNGVGLGLAISRRLINIMGGDLYLGSVEGVGSRFWFDVDLLVNTNIETPEPLEIKTPDTETLHILVVDDNQINILAASVILKQAGYTVTTAVHGREAIDKIRAGRFDVVLMDVHMPVMDGVEATMEIRKGAAGDTRDIPVIGVTASVMQDEINYFLDAGMDAVVEKPIEPETLIQTISGLQKHA